MSSESLFLCDQRRRRIKLYEYSGNNRMVTFDIMGQHMPDKSVRGNAIIKKTVTT